MTFRHAFYPIRVITIYCGVMLKSCFRKWTLSASHNRHLMVYIVSSLVQLWNKMRTYGKFPPTTPKVFPATWNVRCSFTRNSITYSTSKLKLARARIDLHLTVDHESVQLGLALSHVNSQQTVVNKTVDGGGWYVVMRNDCFHRG